MKRSLILLLVILTLVAPSAVLVFASDIDSAQYKTTITISNNGSAAEDVFATFSLNTTAMIDGGLLLDNASDVVMIADGGDTAFTPSVNDSYPWCTYVPSIGGNSQKVQYLYSVNATGGQIVWFPGDAGSTNATAMPSLADNFTIEQSGWVDTISVNSTLIGQPDAFKTYISAAENITSGIWGWNTPSDNVSSGWDDGALARDDNTGTGASTTLTDPGTTAFLELSLNPILTDQVRYYLGWGGSGGPWETIDLDAYYNGGWQDVYEGSLSYGAWITKTLGGEYIVSSIRMRFTCSDGGDPPNEASITVYEADFGSYYPSVTASGISSGNMTVKTMGIANEPQWATGNVLHFDGMENSYIDCGAVYDVEDKFWVSCWFKLDSDFDVTATTNQYIWGKFEGANDFVQILLFKGTGKLIFDHKKDGELRFSLNSEEVEWKAGVWYHVLASISNTNGARLIVNNGEKETSSNTTSVDNGANFIIGCRNTGATDGFIGNIQNVIVGTDDLSEAEETQLFYGTIPSDATDCWYIDEGIGTSIISYGTEANTGTAASATTWQTINRTSSSDYITFVSIPDTQAYVEYYPERFTAQTQWIVNNQDEQNIVFVVHEGDIVDDTDNTTQWERAKEAMDILYDGEVPYSVVPGNHDSLPVGEDYTNYDSYFPYTDFVGQNLQGGHYPSDSNRNNYALLTTSSEDFIILNIDGWDLSAGAVSWANTALTTYASHKAIIVTHAYINSTGGFTVFAGAQGQYIYDNIVKLHSNVIAVICGHEVIPPSAEAYSISASDEGTVINNLLANYQADPDGRLRLYRYYPSLDRFEVLTYSPYTGLYEYDNSSHFETNPTGRLCDFTLQVNNNRQGVNLKGVSVPDNSENWTFCEADAMPYVEYQDIWLGDTQVQHIEWEYDTTFHDSINNYDIIPTFRTTSSDADVSAVVASQEGLITGSIPSANVSGGWTMIGSVPAEPENLFSEGADSYGIGGFNIGEQVTAAAEGAGDPPEVWHFLFAFGLCTFVMVIVYGGTHNAKTGQKGSLMMAVLAGGLAMVFFYRAGTIPGWVLIPFGLIAVLLIMWRKSPSPVD